MEGILPLYKPKGMTSHDCVFRLRKILRTKKIGHTGTLDPEVDGVLPICIGLATKVAEFIMDAGKVYEAEITLGISTTTEDQTGEIVEEKEIKRPISRDEIINVLHRLTGEIVQTPPMYSAVKVKGKKLYEYAREGIEVERPSRKVHIESMELLSEGQEFSGKTISFKIRVSCGKGTYIRTLAVMIGDKLGYPAHMSQLTRIRSAQFTLDDCVTFSQIENLMELNQLDKVLRPLEDALIHLPKYDLSDKLIEKVKNGSVLKTPEIFMNIDGPIKMVAPDQKVLAIYAHHPTKEGFIKPIKVLRNE